MVNKLLRYIFILLSVTANAQENKINLKTIEVIGEAEQEIIPDEIYLQIILKEYKKGGRKVKMNKLESELISAVEELGLPSNHLTVESIYVEEKKTGRLSQLKIF